MSSAVILIIVKDDINQIVKFTLAQTFCLTQKEISEPESDRPYRELFTL